MDFLPGKTEMWCFHLEKKQLREDMTEVYKTLYGMFISSSKPESRAYQMNKRQTWKQVKEAGSSPKRHVYWCLLNTQWIYWVVKIWKQAGFYYYIAVSCILSLFLLFLPHMVIGKVKLSDHGQLFSLVKHTFIATKQKPENIINHIYIYTRIYTYSSTKHPDSESGPFLQYNTKYF